ncbi:MAG: glycosyltransferase family 2 protein [Candidatus Polarisedimenticolia bacterium]
MLAEAIFWVSLLLLAYTWAGYPLLLRIRARLRPAPPRRAPIEPLVSVVLIVHDEAERIEGRLRNLLDLDYPEERLEILVGSDGSTDDTVARARRADDRRLRVSAFPVRRGKPAVINDLVPQARGEIVVFADARQWFEAGALRSLVASFADPAVGAVGGELVLDGGKGTAVGDGIGAYWRLESAIRRGESLVDSTVGATGAFYAIRRSLFAPIPEDTLLDDVLVPMRIAKRGARVVHDPGARAHDRNAGTGGGELARKVRTIAGTFQLFARERWLLLPWRNRLWLQTLSHKGLRLLGPPLLAGAFLSSLWLAGRPFYRLALLSQALFYAAALAGASLRRRPRLFSIPYVVCLLTLATVVGLLRLLTGRQKVTWERAPL